MREHFLDHIKKEIVLCDGAMGTQLYESGIYLNRCFDEINLTEPDTVEKIHRKYIEVGSRVIQTNTFGANIFKLKNSRIVICLNIILMVTNVYIIFLIDFLIGCSSTLTFK